MNDLITLALDAATYTGTVAIIAGNRVLAECEAAMRGKREERLMPAVAAVLAAAGVGVADLGRVVCGAGPGSFTSLRIAGSIAKGIATGRNIPLYAVSSLLLIVAGNRAALPPGRYLATLDAMRGDVFVAGYERGPAGEIVDLEPERLLSRRDLAELTSRLDARPAGPAEELAVLPQARGVVWLADWLERAGPVSLASWEPRYGRLAEAQVRWEAAHGRPLDV